MRGPESSHPSTKSHWSNTARESLAAELLCIGLSTGRRPWRCASGWPCPSRGRRNCCSGWRRRPPRRCSSPPATGWSCTWPRRTLAQRPRSACARSCSRWAAPEALEHLYEHQGEAALVHLFRVASSLDSMVLGEAQILGQVKDAFERGQGAGAVRGELTRACAAAFGCAKRVRTETAIGRAATSMAAAAVAAGQQGVRRAGGQDGAGGGRGRDGRSWRRGT